MKVNYIFKISQWGVIHALYTMKIHVLLLSKYCLWPKVLIVGLGVYRRFILPLDEVDQQLLMEGENLLWVSRDAVFVLQHPGDPIILRFILQLPSFFDRFQILPLIDNILSFCVAKHD